MIIRFIRIILELVGLATIVWFVTICYEEYMNIKREKENKDG